MRIGIDVGGTHTDAVLVQGSDILASTKALSSADVLSGILNALHTILDEASVETKHIEAIMIGTTQFTNAVVERRELSKVAAIRIGAPSGKGLPPMIDWPEDLSAILGNHVYTLQGGFLYDNWPLAELDETEISHTIADIKSRGLLNIAISSVFSSMNPEPEISLGKKIKQAIPEARITYSHKIGRIGLLERENAAILNTALLPFAEKVIDAFEGAMSHMGMTCPVFVSQNDGTLMNTQFVKQYPALTFSSGPTNSLRGASKLTGIKDAIVVDIGGTTSDIGVLQNGFPRESSSIVSVGGVRTNFRMPDINPIGLGGGSIVSNNGNTIGPVSVGHNLVTQALIFGGDTLTSSDIIVAAGKAQMGNKEAVTDIPRDTIKQALATMQSMLDDGVDAMKLSSGPVPVILVGGGSILVTGELNSASEIIRPKHAEVANAIGASIAQISGESDMMVSYQTTPREDAIEMVTQQASNIAVAAGAAPKSICVVELEETAIPYMENASTRIRVKVVGDVAALSSQTKSKHSQGAHDAN
ncbi:hydantoinase/oxoprolinase N-terminal domain-containing protein [Glaciecola sp. 2405UD65-10]|uniref:hydantoinase/oxoprolinase N-terminal domain-containing protein n=1 Tax=Glaciecola sp. 2405UD65-10 TaxID=3397244 RepID=UPI003B59ABE8